MPLGCCFNTSDRLQVTLARSGEAGAMHERSKSNALLHATMLVLFGELLGLCVVVRKFECAIEQSFKFDTLPDHLTGGRSLAGMQEVSAAEFYRCKIQDARNF